MPTNLKHYAKTHKTILLISIYNLNIVENTVSISVMNSDFVELMVTTNEYNSKFHSFAMVDDGTNGDLIANDGIFSCIFPFNGNIEVKFYIRAQSNDAISLFPERAEYEFFEYSTISGFNDIALNNKKLILITDFLGRKVLDNRNISHQPLLYIYDDGTVEKKLKVD